MAYRSVKVAVLTDRGDERIAEYCRVADVLVTLGDLSAADLPEVSIPHLYVYGNHDSPASPFPAKEGRYDVHLQVVEVSGVRFGGFQGCLRYKPKGHYLYGEADIAAKLADFPAVDVFVSHATPTCLETPGDPVHRGVQAFDAYLRRTAPRYAFSGHVHARRIALAGETICMSFFKAGLLELRLPA
jgi:Icc-related predicted phosphoesterase